jgi:hypothetical protein
MVFVLVLSLLLNVVFGYGAFNALRKLEYYEAFVAELDSQLKYVLNSMRAIDIRGSFEADDEVGIVFTVIKKLVETLEQYANRE